jgi:hypothetical protein
VYTGSLSPRSKVDNREKRFNAFSRLIFKAQIRAIPAGCGGCDGQPSEIIMGRTSLPIYSASLFLCMQWIFAAAPPPQSPPVHDRQAKSGI